MTSLTVTEAIHCIQNFVEANADRPYPNYKGVKSKDGQVIPAEYPRILSQLRNKIRNVDTRQNLIEAVYVINEAQAEEELAELRKHRALITDFNAMVRASRLPNCRTRLRRIREAWQGTHMSRETCQQLPIYLIHNNFQKTRMQHAMSIIHKLSPKAEAIKSPLIDNIERLLRLQQSTLVQEGKEPGSDPKVTIPRIQEILEAAEKKKLTSDEELQGIEDWAEELPHHDPEQLRATLDQLDKEVQIMLDRVCWGTVAGMLNDLLNKKLPRLAQPFFATLAYVEAKKGKEMTRPEQWVQVGLRIITALLKPIITREIERWGDPDNPQLIYQGAWLRLRAPYALLRLLRDLGLKRFTWGQLQHRLREPQLRAMFIALGDEPIDDFELLIGGCNSLLPKPSLMAQASLLREYKSLKKTVTKEIRQLSNQAASAIDPDSGRQQAYHYAGGIYMSYQQTKLQMQKNPLYEGHAASSENPLNNSA